MPKATVITSVTISTVPKATVYSPSFCTLLELSSSLHCIQLEYWFNKQNTDRIVSLRFVLYDLCAILYLAVQSNYAITLAWFRLPGYPSFLHAALKTWEWPGDGATCFCHVLIHACHLNCLLIWVITLMYATSSGTCWLCFSARYPGGNIRDQMALVCADSSNWINSTLGWYSASPLKYKLSMGAAPPSQWITKLQYSIRSTICLGDDGIPLPKAISLAVYETDSAVSHDRGMGYSWLSCVSNGAMLYLHVVSTMVFQVTLVVPVYPGCDCAHIFSNFTSWYPCTV